MWFIIRNKGHHNNIMRLYVTIWPSIDKHRGDLHLYQWLAFIVDEPTNPREICSYNNYLFNDNNREIQLFVILHCLKCWCCLNSSCIFLLLKDMFIVLFLSYSSFWDMHIFLFFIFKDWTLKIWIWKQMKVVYLNENKDKTEALLF